MSEEYIYSSLMSSEHYANAGIVNAYASSFSDILRELRQRS